MKIVMRWLLIGFLGLLSLACTAPLPPASGFDLGRQKGMEDGASGLSRTPQRYESLYSEADRARFFDGYEAGYNVGMRETQVQPSFGQPLEARVTGNRVGLFEGERNVTVIRAGRPYVEGTRFIEEQTQIVVKSRGSHGPALVERFDCASGDLLGTVQAYEIRDGEPAWAAGMED